MAKYEMAATIAMIFLYLRVCGIVRVFIPYFICGSKWGNE